MYKILVSDTMSAEGLAPLLKSDKVEIIQKKVDEVQDSLAEFDALLVRSGTQVTEELVEQMTNLKIVARAGVGVDNIDIDAATKRGIVVINAPDGNTISTAEHTFAMMASLLRNIPQSVSSVKDGKWERKKYQGAELYGKTLGIVGMGRIGGELAKRAKAFGMSVAVFDPFLTQARAQKLGVDAVDFDGLLEVADIITVHTPLTKDTKGLFNKETIAKAKKGVYLINCARGGIIDEDALVEHIESGHVSGAALDVFVTEPPTNTRLIGQDHIITTPHLGASTVEAQLNVAASVSEEVLQFLEGQPVKNSLNLPTLSKEVYEKIKPYYELASSMGSLVSQCMKVPVKEIELRYGGSIADLDTTILTRTLLAGFIRPRVDSAVNEVNAAMVTKQRGIAYGEKITSDTNGYSNSIKAIVHGENATFTIQGTFVREYGPRIVNMNGFDIDFYPNGSLLYVQHTDRPGVIGNVGHILGEHEVNIATMQVGRKEAGGEAIMMLSFDKPITDDVYNELRKIDDIVSINKIEL
ncbi:phosphoglycerate dehydrogenase [Bacillus solimangrovi]|uniref:D-3-phosphoglycerate dehydrogenase n=1 Tax=Bacillus solimangrovi TaxID=1305675 RepID=A0A1E5LHF6_9BACI|nr:phosphoglycerate dehydrogenase [Bacillus solimangrovi]OEH93507.1 phosphoglycerate dehydrogenase [Bacillus solimangrovi]